MASQDGVVERLAGMSSGADALAVFQTLRPRLFSLAYRMLGTRADADDVVQDAWLRWSRADREALQSAEAWLVTVVTRLAIDRLRSAQVERERYHGFWLPEPIATDNPSELASLAEDLSVAMLWTLERLGPEERASFLLRKAFDYDYGEIARLLGKSEAAVRQLVHRAGERVKQEHRRYTVTPAQHRRVLEEFMQASLRGDREALESLLVKDAYVVGDGGGKVASFLRMIEGGDKVARLFGMVGRYADRVVYRVAAFNGEPGLLRYVDGGIESATAVVTDGSRIVALYVVRNPDKLTQFPAVI